MKGLEVKKQLKTTGISFTRIAKNMNVSPQTLNKMLLVDDIKTGVLDRIAQAAGKDIFFFLGDPDVIYLPKVETTDPDYKSMIDTLKSIRDYLMIFKK